MGELPCAVPGFFSRSCLGGKRKVCLPDPVFWAGPVKESKVREFLASGVDHRRLRVVYYLSNGFEECQGDPSQLRLASGVDILSAHPTPRGARDTCLGVPGVRYDSQLLLRNCPR